MTAADRQAEPEPRTWVTEIWCPPVDDGLQRLHSPMREPEPQPDRIVFGPPDRTPEPAAEGEAKLEEDGAEWDEPEWDSADSDAYQARVEAGLEPEAGL